MQKIINNYLLFYKKYNYFIKVLSTNTNSEYWEPIYLYLIEGGFYLLYIKAIHKYLWLKFSCYEKDILISK